MKNLLLFLLLAARFLCSADYDCVFIGSSPIPLIEALYQHHLGKKVLILEEHAECGGAWRSIEACGIAHADLGCHQIGGDQKVKDFLELYLGCTLVSLDQPTQNNNPLAGNGFYFSHGCHELIENLLHLIRQTRIDLWLSHRLDSLSLDSRYHHLCLHTEGKTVTALKIYYTPMSSFQIEGHTQPPFKPLEYPHIYLLIHDPTPPRFSYLTLHLPGASRAMNLTHFLDLAHTGRQLIAIQVSSEQFFNQGQTYLDEIKKRNLLDPAAYILCTDFHTYKLQGKMSSIPASLQPYVEMLNTSNFSTMSLYIDRWKTILPLYR